MYEINVFFLLMYFLVVLVTRVLLVFHVRACVCVWVLVDGSQSSRGGTQYISYNSLPHINVCLLHILYRMEKEHFM
jgi:hypothetical protein